MTKPHFDRISVFRVLLLFGFCFFIISSKNLFFGVRHFGVRLFVSLKSFVVDCFILDFCIIDFLIVTLFLEFIVGDFVD